MSIDAGSASMLHGQCPTDLELWAESVLGTPDDEDWYDGRVETVLVPPFEVASLRRALARLVAEDRRGFGSDGEATRIARSEVAIAYQVTERVPQLGTYLAVRRDGVPAVVWTEPARNGAELWVAADDDATRIAILDEVLALVRDAASTWRRQAIRFAPEMACHYEHLPPVDPTGVALSSDLTRQLRTNLVVPLTRYAAVAGLVTRRGVLLHGRPGTGKTWAARWVQSQVVGHVTTVVASPLVFGNAAGVVALFELVGADTPCLLVLDDLDVTIGSRHWGDTDALGELLSRLDGPATVPGVFTLATTNDVAALDEALSKRPGRFDVTVVVGDTEAEVRRSLVTALVLSLGVSDDVIEPVVDATSGWTLAEIRDAAQQALLIALDEGIDVDLLAAVRASRWAPQPTAAVGYV